MDRRIAALVALGALSSASDAPTTVWRTPRVRWSKSYPHSSARQEGRYARQRAKGMLDFSASERCVAAIKARQA